MAKANKVTEAEIIACVVAADPVLHEMQDFATRIQRGAVEKIEDPVSAARNFALLARAASEMACSLLTIDAMQKRNAEIEALRQQPK